MLRFLRRRLLSGLITLLVFLAAMFFLVNILVPGDWTSQFILTAEGRAALQEQLGIDRPLWEQFWTWISGVATLNLGTSFRGQPVWDLVRSASATTLFALSAAAVVAFPLGFWLGRVSAWGKERWFSVPSTAVAVFLFTAFPPVVAFLLERAVINVFSWKTYREVAFLDPENWDPVGDPSSAPSPASVLWRMLLVAAIVAVGLALLGWLLRRLHRRSASLGLLAALTVGITPVGWWLAGLNGRAFDMALSLLFLTVGLVILTYGEILLVADAAMVDTRAEDFVLTARAKGLPESAVRDRHSARAAILPVLSRMIVSVPYFFTGLVILEFVFEVQGGMGTLIFDAINNQDTPVIVGAMAVVGVITLGLRLTLETAIAVLDPRSRLPGGEVT